MANKDVGRPTVVSDVTLQLLREGFSMGFTDIECSLYAGIAVSTLYNYCRDNTKFAEDKEILKHKPKMRAKINLDKSIKDGDKDISKWYLERKSRDEFSLKQEVSVGNKDGEDFNVNLSSLTTEQIRELLNNEDKE